MRFTFCCRTFPPLFTAAAVFLLVSDCFAQAGSGDSPIPTRACSANPVLAPGTTKKAAHKSKHPLPPEAAPACIEAKGEPIEIQEFLQSFARDQQWRSGEHHASDDTWSFVRYLNVEELEQYADTKILLEPVKFTSGKAAVVVRTSETSDGYVRVQVTARFQGEGQSEDKVMARPGNVWPLASRGVFEEELLTALRVRRGRAQ